jgi:cation diffusion facilitator family transporter
MDSFCYFTPDPGRITARARLEKKSQMTDSAAITEQREKSWAAASSVIGAVGLTTLKIIVGLATGSLGILAEAAHSGLDLVAAVMTLVAVRISGRPADRSHLYGHGKVESLSALIEAALLLLTCLWILYGAIHRFITGAVEIEVTVWSFAVMITSIVVDVSRSRVLRRAAEKYQSQALAADALHFSTDIWSSAVVILGLVSVLIGDRVPRFAWLRYADAVAATVVAVIVIGVTWKLGVRTCQSLLDAAPPGLEEAITAAAGVVPGIFDVHNVRMRYSGARLFVDVHVLVDGSQSLRQAHDLTDEVERSIQRVIPNADVTVHAEPDERR